MLNKKRMEQMSFRAIMEDTHKPSYIVAIVLAWISFLANVCVTGLHLSGVIQNSLGEYPQHATKSHVFFPVFFCASNLLIGMKTTECVAALKACFFWANPTKLFQKGSGPLY